MTRIQAQAPHTAQRWLQSAHAPNPVARVHDNLCGYGLEDWARELLAEEIVALVKLVETQTLHSRRKAVTQ